MEDRYSQQLLLECIGEEGQEIIRNKHIGIIGVGALGTVSAELLCRAGIGKLTLIDKDIVQLSNLQRQSLFGEDDINKPKASIAKAKLHKVNTDVIIDAHDINFSTTTAHIILNCDLVLDCTDNLDTRFLINEFCHKNNLPWIYASAAKEKGMVFTITKNNVCFNCIFENSSQGNNCQQLGVLNAITYAISCLQVTSALKFILDKPVKELLVFDIWNLKLDKISVKNNPKCGVCKGHYNLLEQKLDFVINKCKTKSAIVVKPKKNIRLNLNNIKQKFTTITETPILLVLNYNGEIIVHNYGELIFKDCKTIEEARKIADEIYDEGR